MLIPLIDVGLGSGFLLKNAPPEQLLAAVRTVAAGDALLAPQITRRIIEEYVSWPRTGASDSHQVRGRYPGSTDWR